MFYPLHIFSGWSCNCHGWDVSERRCRQEREVRAQGVHQRNDGSSRHIQDYVYQEHWRIVGTNVNPLVFLISGADIQAVLLVNLQPGAEPVLSQSDYLTTWSWTSSLSDYLTTWSITGPLSLGSLGA